MILSKDWELTNVMKFLKQIEIFEKKTIQIAEEIRMTRALPYSK